MAKPSAELVEALRRTAARLEAGGTYSWGHPGCCNLGHLAQTVTRWSHSEILRAAAARAGDWGQIALEACPSSGLPIDWVVDRLLELGLTRDDLGRLEDLSDPQVLARIPLERREGLSRNVRGDAVTYLRAWAGLLEERLGQWHPGVVGSGEGAERALPPTPKIRVRPPAAVEIR